MLIGHQFSESLAQVGQKAVGAVAHDPSDDDRQQKDAVIRAHLIACNHSRFLVMAGLSTLPFSHQQCAWVPADSGGATTSVARGSTGDGLAKIPTETSRRQAMMRMKKTENV